LVSVISLDVSDPTNVKFAGEICLTGSILTSRMVGDQLMLMSQYRMNTQIDFEDASTYLPQIGRPGSMKPIPADNIVIPEKLTNRLYTVVTMLDARDLSLIDTGAFMSYSTELYVSKENIYAIRGSTLRETTEENTTVTKAVTEISCMAYSVDGLTPKGTFTVDGTVKNQYSMDEKDGVFRVVTSTNLQQLQEHREDEFTSAMLKQERNANLTCFKVGTWEKLGELKAFAPEGETVESVRFDGNYAYVCTAEVVTMTDPVFFIDMTDLNHITARDTGVIEGYSSSLIQLGDGFLMGIGFGADGFLKVEIYEEGEGRVVSVCSYEEKAGFATAYKAYLIDRENHLFGIPTTEGYILLHFDGYHLHVLERVEMNGNLDNVRGVVIDEYLYVFGDSNVDGSAFEAVKFGQEEEM